MCDGVDSFINGVQFRSEKVSIQIKQIDSAPVDDVLKTEDQIQEIAVIALKNY